MQKQLTQKDRKKLKGKLWLGALFALIVLAFFYGMYLFILRDAFIKTDNFGAVPLVIFGIFALFFFGVIGYMISLFLKDLNSGVKNCIEGVVEDKQLSINKSTSHSTGTGARSGRSSKTSTQRYYYMTVNGEQHKIEYAMYSKIRVGDTVYFEITPSSKTILSFDIRESAADAAVDPQKIFHKSSYPTSRIRQAPLTQEDREIIHEYYSKQLKRRLTYIALFGLPVVGLLINSLEGILLLIFPIPLILLYQIYKTIRLYFNYEKSTKNGRKELVTTHVIDKLFTTITHNGRQRVKYTLKTTYRNVLIPEEYYQEFNAGDEIIAHKAMNLPVVLGIAKDDYYYPF
ncbi:hypothetical protein C8N46_103376 [Kordia periserrulae]|uniref:Uncharacterized protein n=1 Tax=Kordia periserrulae TaxID=701523 RepID=A0A2T6C1S8_9FLAO|nr:hypothetical protein [Kordia periserrulae]PTX62276.1 hypothetical protein C8N46_103376 [Kordia periserrulae]